MKMFSCARTAILWGAFLFLVLGCTRSTHALNVHADSELLAEKPELCFKPPTDSDMYCCTCESLDAARSKALTTIHRQMEMIIQHFTNPNTVSKEEWKKVGMTQEKAMKGFHTVEQCLADFKKKSCPPYQIAPGADGWCSHAGAVHQDVPGCGRVCSDATHRGVKDKNIWAPIADVPCSVCPGAQWPGCAAGTAATCHFTTGDGTGGHETRVTTTGSAAACAAYVRQHHPSANGATWGANSNDCYAEFGMTGQNSNTLYRTCSFSSGLGRRLLLDLPDNDEFRLDEGVADMQLTKPVQDGLDSQLNELQAEYASYTQLCSAW